MQAKSRRAVVVAAYDPSWPLIFERLKAPIWEAVAGLARSVEHVGSTSVPGLAAKPIIDMDVVVPLRTAMPGVIERLARIGYRHCGDLGIEGREAFENPPGLPPHHLYACIEGGVALANHLMVRDYLRAHSCVADAYGAFKRQLAERFFADPQAYGEGKTGFLLSILDKAGSSHELLDVVRAANKRLAEP